eukprot:NODE_1750_length_1392_cov_31.466403_g1661_i0.p1 GENE.NODE_1750_length_1392_cov_31.466403_g1661_i0~~NODE_1750_length_1392_cov_31.466403_g1661_i0.p1  ORF type:complete len:275 (+),score=82.67 NODE_1750_length_1392_cov_31.466403_g1661_i0:486-1310(+)
MALQATQFDGSDLCLYYGPPALTLWEQYNQNCTTGVLHPVSKVPPSELYQLLKPYSGGKHLQLVQRAEWAVVSFEERAKAVVAQSVLHGTSLQGACLQFELVDGFQADYLDPFPEAIFVFPIGEEVTRVDVLDVFDRFLALDHTPPDCISINRDTSIASVRGFCNKAVAHQAWHAVNGLHLRGTELMVRFRLADLTLPKESRIFASNVGDDVMPTDLYTIFHKYAGGLPMQVVIKRSKRYALIGFRRNHMASDAVTALGNIQVKSSFLYLYLSD